MALNQIQSLAVTDQGSQVDYQGLSRDPLYQKYHSLAAGLANFNFQELSEREEKLAFWINLYNALVVDAVIQTRVKKSVTESFLGILSFFQRAAYKVGGQRFSLTDIEHGVLRGDQGFPYFPGPHFSSQDIRKLTVVQPLEPRIHFALNCASASCPPIAVYSPEKIEAQLDLAARSFLSSELEVDRERKQLSVSSIFKWYQVDFGGPQGVLNFVIRHSPQPDLAEWLADNRDQIHLDFLPYDWSLNSVNK